MGEERSNRFMITLVEFLKSEYGNIDYISEKVANLENLCLQKDLGPKLDHLLSDFDTGIYKNKEKIKEMISDVNLIKSNVNISIKHMLQEHDNLDELLLKSKHLDEDALKMRNESKQLEIETRCIKPWLAYTLIFLFVGVIVYVVFAFVRCGNLRIICD